MQVGSETNLLDSIIDPQKPWIVRRPYTEFPPQSYRKTVTEWNALLNRARQRDAEAEMSVAAYYEYGCKDMRGRILVKRSSRTAAKWYRLAAEHGDPGAQLALGYILDEGRGVKKNQTEALVWYKRAFRGGYIAPAVVNIAITHRQASRLRQATYWFKKAAEEGKDAGAGVQLGIHFYWGKGVRADHARAVRLFRKATIATDPTAICEFERDDAFFFLAIAYLEGKGVRKSLANARELLERAGKDGDHPPAAGLLRRITKFLRTVPSPLRG